MPRFDLVAKDAIVFGYKMHYLEAGGARPSSCCTGRAGRAPAAAERRPRNAIAVGRIGFGASHTADELRL